MVELAKSINVWENCDEPVQLQLKPKPNNAYEYRYIFQFGIENQIRQVLVRNAIKAQSEYIQNQYLMNGGRDKAIKAVQHHYKQGYKFVQELDVYHCFRSFKMEGVAKYLSLPKEVTAQVLSGSHLSILYDSYKRTLNYSHDEDGSFNEFFVAFESDWDEVRSGLTEGSKASPFAAEKLLAYIIEQFPVELGVVVNYADNFLCMSESENGAFEVQKYFRTVLHNHPAGPLKFKTGVKIHRPNEDFEFLGYYLEPTFPNALKCNLGRKAKIKWKRQIKDVYHNLGNSDISLPKKAATVNRLFCQLQSQASGYQMWDERDYYIKKKMQRIVKTAGKNGVTHNLLDTKLMKFITNQD